MANCLQATAFSAGGALDRSRLISARSLLAGELWLSAAAVAAWAGIADSTQASKAVKANAAASRRAIGASERSWTHLKPHDLFPLIPTLSPRERESPGKRLALSCTSRLANRLAGMLPLPRGGGAGGGGGIGSRRADPH